MALSHVKPTAAKINVDKIILLIILVYTPFCKALTTLTVANIARQGGVWNCILIISF